jgi:hypothetical protein
MQEPLMGWNALLEFLEHCGLLLFSHLEQEKTCMFVLQHRLSCRVVGYSYKCIKQALGTCR